MVRTWLDGLMGRVCRGRKLEFDLQRAVFAMVANRVLEPRSKRGMMSWMNRAGIAGDSIA